MNYLDDLARAEREALPAHRGKPPRLRPGVRVRHAEHGDGTVNGTLPRGRGLERGPRKVQVAFDDGQTRVIRNDELQPLLLNAPPDTLVIGAADAETRPVTLATIHEHLVGTLDQLRALDVPEKDRVWVTLAAGELAHAIRMLEEAVLSEEALSERDSRR